MRQVEDELSIMKTSYFIQRRYSILAQSIALAIGPFEVLPDPQLPLVTHFYPPHVSRESMLHTVEFMKRVCILSLAAEKYNCVLTSISIL